jgi:hypothetical protein
MLSIELNHQPKILLAAHKDLECQVCAGLTAIIIADRTECVHCMILKAGKDTIIISGWALNASGKHINASRIPT